MFEAWTAAGVGQRAGQVARERGFLFGAEKSADFDALAARDQRHPLRAEFLVDFLFEPHPGRVEAPDLALAAGGDLLENELERRHFDGLIGVGGAEAYLEGDIKRQDVEPHEADHRPGANDEEGQGDNEIDAAERDNESVCSRAASLSGKA